jgi:hypothetical protein
MHLWLLTPNESFFFSFSISKDKRKTIIKECMNRGNRLMQDPPRGFDGNQQVVAGRV